MGMDLNYTRIRYFLECGRSGNLTRAAANLFISQPSLSKQIALLEEEIGAPLFKRSKKGLEFTQAGRTLFEEFSLIDERMINAYERVKRVSAEEQFRLSIISFEMLYLGEVIERSICRYAKLYGADKIIFLRSGPERIIPMFSDDTLDIAIGHEFVFERMPFDFDYYPIPQRTLYLAVPADSPIRSSEDITPQKLSEFPFIMIDTPYSKPDIESVFVHWKESDFKPIMRYVPNFESVYDCVGYGLGVSITDSAIQHEKGDAVRLLSLNGTFLEKQTDQRRVVCAWKKGQTSLGVEEFLSMVRAGYARDAAGGEAPGL